MTYLQFFQVSQTFKSIVCKFAYLVVAQISKMYIYNIKNKAISNHDGTTIQTTKTNLESYNLIHHQNVKW